MYKLDFTDEGKASLASLDKKISQRVLNKLKWLIQNIESTAPLPLRKNLARLNKLRIGDWRVIYKVSHDSKVVTVHKVGHRREIYK